MCFDQYALQLNIVLDIKHIILCAILDLYDTSTRNISDNSYRIKNIIKVPQLPFQMPSHNSVF